MKKQEDVVVDGLYSAGLSNRGLTSNGLTSPITETTVYLLFWILSSALPQPPLTRGIWYDWGIWLEDALWYG